MAKATCPSCGTTYDYPSTRIHDYQARNWFCDRCVAENRRAPAHAVLIENEVQQRKARDANLLMVGVLFPPYGVYLLVKALVRRLGGG